MRKKKLIFMCIKGLFNLWFVFCICSGGSYPFKLEILL